MSARNPRSLPSNSTSLSAIPFILATLSFTLGLDGWLATKANSSEPVVIVLGIAQDAGFPQASCKRDCCREAWRDPTKRRFATSIGIVDPQSNQRILFECTPNFPDQMQTLNQVSRELDVNTTGLNGIFLSHAHIGHYAGLIHLGREVIGADSVPVYVMPKMRQFLIANGPWSQLVELKNISLRRLLARQPTSVGRLKITPVLVPHRDEFSETVAFRIEGPNRSLLFLPDIDKWKKWERKIEAEIRKVDIALIDGTFFNGQELPGRDISKIPHPFVVESLARFRNLPAKEKAKIHFLHFNHTNQLLQPDSSARKALKAAGFPLIQQGQRFKL